jgi:hypothetical protein
MRITEAILRDQSTVLSISSLIDNYLGLSDMCFSLPTVVDRGGVEQVIHLELDKDEVEKLRHSAELLKTYLFSASQSVPFYSDLQQGNWQSFGSIRAVYTRSQRIAASESGAPLLKESIRRLFLRCLCHLHRSCHIDFQSGPFVVLRRGICRRGVRR